MRSLLRVVLLFCFLCLALPILGFGQGGTAVPACGTAFMDHFHGFDTLPRRSTHSRGAQAEDDGRIMVIPVVVHIIHDGSANMLKISDASVQSQIDVLNEDFGRYGNGTNDTAISMDARIRFCLARIDPQGKPTTGINRVQSPYSEIRTDQEMETKNLSRWDRTRYLNIWVVKSIQGGGSNTVLGYSYRPSNLEAAKKFDIDGVVIAYTAFGRNQPYQSAGSPSRLGRTCTHEVGHYLDLMHTWGGDGPNQGGCNDDDGIDDTPLCSAAFSAKYYVVLGRCNTEIQCGYTRLVEDYMDYSEDRCQNIFTKGQAARMRQAILVYRKGLIVYPNLVTTGCQELYLQENPPQKNSLEVHPNPTTGLLYFYPNFTESLNVTVSVYTYTGKYMGNFELTDVKFDRQAYELVGLAQGMYILVAQTPKDRWTYKLMIFSGL